MDEQVLALLGSLVEIKSELGVAVYEAAVERARLVVAAEVMVEAERRASRRRVTLREVDNVVFLARMPEASGGGDGHR
jgi:hypothetical protein